MNALVLNCTSLAQRVLERMDWNRGPGPGADYMDTPEGHDWSARTGRQAADNLFDVARAPSRAELRHGAG